MLLILIGSLITLMEKIFSDAKESLFGRATRKIYLNPFGLPIIASILRDLNFKTKKEIFDLYFIFNGIPKYFVLLEEEELQGKSLELQLKNLLLVRNPV